MNLLVNGRGDAVPNAATVVEAIRRANPDLPVEESTIVGAPPPVVAAERRARAWTIGVAAVLILLQTVVTFYGAAAYAAARRSREYALKMAIGAARSRIAFDVLRSGTQPPSGSSHVGINPPFRLTSHWTSGQG